MSDEQTNPTPSKWSGMTWRFPVGMAGMVAALLIHGQTDQIGWLVGGLAAMGIGATDPWWRAQEAARVANRRPLSKASKRLALASLLALFAAGGAFFIWPGLWTLGATAAALVGIFVAAAFALKS